MLHRCQTFTWCLGPSPYRKCSPYTRIPSAFLKPKISSRYIRLVIASGASDAGHATYVCVRTVPEPHVGSNCSLSIGPISSQAVSPCFLVTSPTNNHLKPPRLHMFRTFLAAWDRAQWDGFYSCLSRPSCRGAQQSARQPRRTF